MLLLGTIGDPQHEVDDDGQQQNDGQDRGAEAVVEPGLPPHPYRPRPPVVREQGVHHGEHGDAGEEEGRDEGDAVAKVEHADGEGAEDDGEVEPRQEGPLVGEEDLGLDPGREGNALAWGNVVSRRENFGLRFHVTYLGRFGGEAAKTWLTTTGERLQRYRSIAVGGGR